MKLYKLLFAIMSALLIISCSNDELIPEVPGSNTDNSQDGDAYVSVNIGQGIQGRSMSDITGDEGYAVDHFSIIVLNSSNKVVGVKDYTSSDFIMDNNSHAITIKEGSEPKFWTKKLNEDGTVKVLVIANAAEVSYRSALKNGDVLGTLEFGNQDRINGLKAGLGTGTASAGQEVQVSVDLKQQTGYVETKKEVSVAFKDNNFGVVKLEKLTLNTNTTATLSLAEKGLSVEYGNPSDVEADNGGSSFINGYTVHTYVSGDGGYSSQAIDLEKEYYFHTFGGDSHQLKAELDILGTKSTGKLNISLSTAQSIVVPMNFTNIEASSISGLVLLGTDVNAKNGGELYQFPKGQYIDAKVKGQDSELIKNIDDNSRYKCTWADVRKALGLSENGELLNQNQTINFVNRPAGSKNSPLFSSTLSIAEWVLNPDLVLTVKDTEYMIIPMCINKGWDHKSSTLVEITANVDGKSVVYTNNNDIQIFMISDIKNPKMTYPRGINAIFIYKKSLKESTDFPIYYEGTWTNGKEMRRKTDGNLTIKRVRQEAITGYYESILGDWYDSDLPLGGRTWHAPKGYSVVTCYKSF